MIFATMIVTAERAQQACTVDASQANFPTALSTTGSEPPSHFISSGFVSDEYLSELQAALGDDVIISSDNPWSLITQKGLKIVAPEDDDV